MALCWRHRIILGECHVLVWSPPLSLAPYVKRLDFGQEAYGSGGSRFASITFKITLELMPEVRLTLVCNTTGCDHTGAIPCLYLHAGQLQRHHGLGLAMVGLWMLEIMRILISLK